MPNSETKRPLLDEILSIRNLPLQPMYTVRQVATIFGVSARAIHAWVAAGQLVARDLPGRARFLNQDIEDFLMSSRKDRT